MSPWLSPGLSLTISQGLILLFPGMVVMWSLSGGLTVLRHYIIRWLLARRHTFPWRTQAFLDDATTRILLRRVGGGYSFIHRRLQDYFADAALPTPQGLMRPSLTAPVSTGKTKGKKKSCIILLCNVLILLVSVGGVIGVVATTTIAQIREENATVTAQIREGNSTALYPPQGKPLVLDDPLRDNTKGNKWEEDTTSGDCKFIHGAFDIINKKIPDNSEWCPAKGTDFTNFIYEVQMKIVAGDNGGIAFRVDPHFEDQFYSFVVNPNGTYSINRSIDNWSFELAHGASPAIHRGLKQTNLIAAVSHGSTLELYVNHTRIAVVYDTTFTHGMIAVIVESLKNQTEVIFQNAKVWML